MPYTVQPEDIVSKQRMFFPTSRMYGESNLHFASVSGVALTGIKGDSQNWKRDTLTILAPAPRFPVTGLVTGSGMDVAIFSGVEWTLHVGLNSVYNINKAVNSGHAVDAYRVTNADSFEDVIQIECDIAVSDVDAYLYRVAYKLDMLVYNSGRRPA